MSDVIGSNFVYVHMPKTAGTWVSRYLINNGFGAVRGTRNGMGAHGQGRSVAPNSLVGTIRDPWRWYASLFSYMRSLEGDDWIQPFTGDSPSVSRAIERMVDPSDIDTSETKTQYRGFYCVRSLYTHHVLRSYGVDGCVCDGGGTERLLPGYYIESDCVRFGIIDVLRDLGHVVTPEHLVRAIRYQRQLPSDSDHAFGYTMKPELKDMIMKHDSWAVARFGYEPGKLPDQHVWKNGND